MTKETRIINNTIAVLCKGYGYAWYSTLEQTKEIMICSNCGKKSKQETKKEDK